MQQLIRSIQNFFNRLLGVRETPLNIINPTIPTNQTNTNTSSHSNENENTNNPSVPPIRNYHPAPNAPNSHKFKAAYLDYNNYSASNVWNLIGGGLNDSYGDHGTIDDIANSCAARVSRGLNYSSAKIPKGSIGANRNYDGRTPGDNLYYIIQARKLRKYLKQSWGTPNQTLTHVDQIQVLKDNLQENQYAVIVSDGHAGAVSPHYEDNYIRHYLGDMWILPI